MKTNSAVALFLVMMSLALNAKPLTFSHKNDELKILSLFDSKESVYDCRHQEPENVCTYESNQSAPRAAKLNDENFRYLIHLAEHLPGAKAVAMPPNVKCQKRFSVVELRNGPTQKYWTSCLDAKTLLNKRISKIRKLILDLL